MSKKVSKPRHETPVLERAIRYAQLDAEQKSVDEMHNEYGENPVTIYKYIRLGNAPKAVHAYIRKKKISANAAADVLLAGDSPEEMTAKVKALVEAREKDLDSLKAAGISGKSMTFPRKVTLALEEMKKKRLLTNRTQKEVAKTIEALFSSTKITKDGVVSIISSIR
jgi:ParB-like chromosome segregation protein Spo0J